MPSKPAETSNFDSSLTARFATLFYGSPHYFIVCRAVGPAGKSIATVRRAHTVTDIQNHLFGILGLGVSPLLPDHQCRFAAIDVDRTDDQDEVDFEAIAQAVTAAQLPLVLCRSRSGGAHLYLFLARPAPAVSIRAIVDQWAKKLNLPGTDCIIPSADYQNFEDDGTPHISRSINLPYFNSNATDRYAFAADGKTHLSLTEFLDLAEAQRVNPALIGTMIYGDHQQAPPCVQRMINEGIPNGLRNEGLTQIAIYLRRIDRTGVKPRLHDINLKACAPPLELSEVRKIAESASRREYRYRCKSEPAHSLCDSATCLRREFGIKPDEDEQRKAADQLVADLPAPSDFALVQKTAAGGVYRMRINGKMAVVSLRSLLNVREAQMFFMEDLGIMLPAKLRYTTWYEHVMGWVHASRYDIQADEDTDYGVMKALINDMIADELASQGSDDMMAYRDRLSTSPIMYEVKAKDGSGGMRKEVAFRLTTLQQYCANHKAWFPRDMQLVANLFRLIGLTKRNIWTRKGPVQAWCLTYDPEVHKDVVPEIPRSDANSDY